MGTSFGTGHAAGVAAGGLCASQEVSTFFVQKELFVRMLISSLIIANAGELDMRVRTNCGAEF